MLNALCAGCGAKITWAVTEQRKRIPLDTMPEKRFVYFPATDDMRLVDTYQTHFASCPKAGQFRRRKE